MTKTIKNVDEETWRAFKVLSARAGLSMGILLRFMVKEFERNNKEFWSTLLTKGKLLSDVEAEDMLKTTKNLRKERGFRE